MVTNANVEFLLQILLILSGMAAKELTMKAYGRTDHANSNTTCHICNCSSFDQYEYVNCSYRQLKELPNDIPSNAVELHFEYNMIQTKVQLPSAVLRLHGRNNQLTDIFGMFNESCNITVVDLRRNRITSLPKETFACCHKLKHL
ncbi:leucine-rich repeat-containing protein 3-like [Amphiura filiformis]|uniref:leucine-rich repeat-containing protein 3-like n=1 Tax=Amphiura filiformis TaxID=82378 RepID=UPI003B22897D